MAALAPSVADAVLRWFSASAECHKKIPTSQWTVLAGVVVVSQYDDDSATPTLRVVAAATGNKCLGRRDLHANGLVANDCHAEILARRALLRYLYTEALTWTAGSEDRDASLFERHSVTQRLTLKTQHTLHLFISEAPCGDAAIYQLRDDVVNELVKQRVERTADAKLTHAAEAVTSQGVQQIADEERSAFRLTGAKAKRKRDEPSAPSDGDEHSTSNHHHQEPPPQEKRFAQMVGIARVKSGRSDLPPDKQTFSMSCSDKIAKWSSLGVQGTLLLQFYEPLLLKSIVVSLDDASVSAAAQQEAMQRAISGRLQPYKDDTQSATELHTSCEVHIVSHSHNSNGFQRKRTRERAASSLALNWTCREAHWSSTTTSADKAPHTALLLKFFDSANVEVLMAATGLKQGAKKIAKMSISETQKVASRLAKWTLFLVFQHILSTERTVSRSSDSENVQSVCLPYQQQKDAIPVKRPDVSSDSSRAIVESVLLIRERKRAFLRAIETWIGVPDTFKQFTVDFQQQ